MSTTVPATAPLTILSIHQVKGTYLFQVQTLGDGANHPVISARQSLTNSSLPSQIEQASRLLNQLVQPSASRDLQFARPEAAGDPLLALGRLLYSQFLPFEIQEALRELPAGTPLLIVTDTPHLLWELAHDGADYLASRFQLARQLLVARPLRRMPEARGPRWSALLIGNPTGNLPEADNEIEQLARIIEATPGAMPPRILMRRRATKDAVLNELASGSYQLIHYSGHTRYNPREPDAGGLVLANDQLLSASEIRRALAGHPFVFLNGCESAKSPVASLPSTNLPFADDVSVLTQGARAAGGLAGAFIEGGAVGFLGNVWPIQDGTSSAFALVFYRAALDGVLIAQAVAEARAWARRHTAPMPLWAGYLLFADPVHSTLVPYHRERRPVTILAIQLLKADQLFNSQPLEQASEQVELLFADCAQLIRRHGGHVQFATQELILGVFGYPVTQADDAERAVTAGLALLERAGAQAHLTLSGLDGHGGRTDLDGHSGRTDFETRLGLGIASGDILVRSTRLTQDNTLRITGPSLGQATQLARTAGGATLLIDAGTRRMLGDRFQLTSYRAAGAEGEVEQPTYAVAGVAMTTQRVEESTPLVGRLFEMEQLLDAWEQCRKGRGRLLGVVGEAGIGKTRLLQELQQRVSGAACRWIATTCPSDFTPGAYDLVKELFSLLLNLPVAEGRAIEPAITLQHIEASLAALPSTTATKPPHHESAALLGNMLGLSLPDGTLAHLDAKRYQQRLLDLLVRLLGQTAATTPLILVLDDLHWCDEASLEIIHQLTAHLDQMAVLFVALYRSEGDWQPPWWNRRSYRQIHLGALDLEACRLLLAARLGHGAPAQQLVETVYARSHGNPFFVRELVVALREMGAIQRDGQQWRLVRGVHSEEIPASVQRVLLARIEHLPPAAQRLLCQAAVIGESFDRELLAAISLGVEETTVDRLLAELAEHDYLYRSWDDESYHFRHGLLRQVAYGKLGNEERRRYHLRIGESLEERSGGQSADPERLAHHFYAAISNWDSSGRSTLIPDAEEASLARARDYLLQAGDKAVARYAAREALRHYVAAQELAQRLPAATARIVEIESGLGEAYQIVSSFEESLAHFTRAYHLVAATPELSCRLGPAQLAQRIGRLYEWKSEYLTALRWLERGLEYIGEPQGQTEVRSAATLHLRIGSVHYNQGNLSAAAHHAQIGLELATSINDLLIVAEGNNLLGVLCDVQGESKQAMAYYEQSLANWRALGDEHQAARLEDNLGQLLLNLGEWQGAQLHLEQGYGYWEKIEDGYNLAFASLNLGQLALYRGNWEEAMDRFSSALAIWSATQNVRWMALCHTNLGLLHLARKEWATAEQHLQNSLRLLTESAIRDLLPEVYYGLAEVAFGDGSLAAARSYAQQAMTLAADLGLQLELALAQRTLGKVCRAEGDNTTAHQQWQESLMRLQALGNRYEIARTQLCLAELAHGQLDEEMALRLMDEATATFTALDAHADLATVQQMFGHLSQQA